VLDPVSLFGIPVQQTPQRLRAFGGPLRTYKYKVRYVYLITRGLENLLYSATNIPFDDECRLLGYKTPVRTSHEAHYFTATELSQLMLRKS
jgi:hypothetical protein